MENTQLKILSEIKASLESLKSPIDILEAKVDAVAVLLPEPEDSAPEEDLPVEEPVPAEEPEPVELEPEPVPAEEEPVELEPEAAAAPAEESVPVVEDPVPVVEEPVVSDDPIDLDISDIVVPEPAAEVHPVKVEGELSPMDEEPIEISIDAPEDPVPAAPVRPAEAPEEAPANPFGGKKPLELNDAEALKEKHALLDKMTGKQSWRADMPGTKVSNIISAISLNDRVLFINSLFGEDPMEFRSTIDALNSMGSMEEAIGYITSAFPDWNLDSDVVYRFMMAVRRRFV